MTPYILQLVLIGALVSCGVYMLLERNLTRMLLGLLLVSNGINLLILYSGGRSGNPPVYGRSSANETTTADPLAQAMILTAIVITMGVAAFVLALTYRSYRLTTAEEVADDIEDTSISKAAETADISDIDDIDDIDEAAITHPDTDEPDELDALPGREGSR
ncbi:Na(+)/H(+) antiporter subunit C [[Mycobacterium] wendilense]|uniref:Na(+)/H(+) antiporter subunit C n=1 Tax=[Mycobacterium] wendilense TaxID=3064284 RepID=A0ABM9MI49_9MYCO|nr:Na(+)/H(+) antiporter subunit C [Mycolicibacterium sp. MU0050]CAJ1585764.1 Na(+)/H(+) antiporter subunit C [Mycolicibacterium sp. MU0050]